VIGGSGDLAGESKRFGPGAAAVHPDRLGAALTVEGGDFRGDPHRLEARGGLDGRRRGRSGGRGSLLARGERGEQSKGEERPRKHRDRR
jgi:hypothetical protein